VGDIAISVYQLVPHISIVIEQMEIRMALHTEAVQDSLMAIGKPRANRRSSAERHVIIDKSWSF